MLLSAGTNINLCLKYALGSRDISNYILILVYKLLLPVVVSRENKIFLLINDTPYVCKIPNCQLKIFIRSNDDPDKLSKIQDVPYKLQINNIKYLFASNMMVMFINYLETIYKVIEPKNMTETWTFVDANFGVNNMGAIMRIINGHKACDEFANKNIYNTFSVSKRLAFSEIKKICIGSNRCLILTKTQEVYIEGYSNILKKLQLPPVHDIVKNATVNIFIIITIFGEIYTI